MMGVPSVELRELPLDVAAVRADPYSSWAFPASDSSQERPVRFVSDPSPYAHSSVIESVVGQLQLRTRSSRCIRKALCAAHQLIRKRVSPSHRIEGQIVTFSIPTVSKNPEQECGLGLSARGSGGARVDVQ
jgi:hypothetical protein